MKFLIPVLMECLTKQVGVLPKGDRNDGQPLTGVSL